MCTFERPNLSLRNLYTIYVWLLTEARQKKGPS